MTTTIITGIAASPGIAIGRIYAYTTHKAVVEQAHDCDYVTERTRLQCALEQARIQLQSLQETAQQKLSAEDASIFDAHALLIEDPELSEHVQTMLSTMHTSAEYAWQEGTRHFAQQLRELPDEYLTARANDIEDIARRVLRLLQGAEAEGPLQLHEPAILIAEDLTPSDTVTLDRQYIQALVEGFLKTDALQMNGTTQWINPMVRRRNIPWNLHPFRNTLRN